MLKIANNMLTAALIFTIRLYKALFSYWLGGRCRFVPSCSDYAIMAIREFGPFKGSVMAVSRILRCNPCCKGGYDTPGKT